MWIVELEKGVWLSEGEGDPCRTKKKSNAAGFYFFENAEKAIEKARKFRPFENAQIFFHRGNLKPLKLKKGEWIDEIKLKGGE